MKTNAFKLKTAFIETLCDFPHIAHDLTIELVDYKHTPYIVSWRNDPDNLDLFEKKTALSTASQNSFIDNYDHLNRIDLILLRNGEPIGVFNIKNLDSQPEYGSLIGNKSCRGKGIGTQFKKAIFHYWFFQLNQNKIYIKIRPQNKFLIESNLKLGFKELRREEDGIFLFSLNKKDWDG